jgi:hypothetical protein
VENSAVPELPLNSSFGETSIMKRLISAMLNKGQYLRKVWFREVSSCLDEAESSDWEDVVQLPNNRTTVVQYTALWCNAFSLNHVAELEDAVASFVPFVGIRRYHRHLRFRKIACACACA